MRKYIIRFILAVMIGFFIVVLGGNNNLGLFTWLIGFILMCFIIVTFIASFGEDEDMCEGDIDVIK